MTDHPLDRPIWAALTADHARFARGDGPLRTYPADLSPFAATVDDGPDSLDALAQWREAKRSLLFLQATPAALPADWEVELQAEAVQMVMTGPPHPAESGGGTGAINTPQTDMADTIVPLGPEDAQEMLALATMTKPGPFSLRSQDLGPFWGIKRQGRLIAMGGMRLQSAPFTEVSGLCTLPALQGQGMGRAMLRYVTDRVVADGRTAFLHAYAANTHAIRLYESLGFQVRCAMFATVARPPHGV